MTIDNESPAGAWKEEMKAAPWGYGQTADNQVRHALAAVRAKGLWVEAGILEQRIVSLEVEIERVIK